MINCRICGANCDPGDLIGGVCDDCRTEKTKEEQRQDEMNRLSRMIMDNKYKQISIMEVLENGFCAN